MNKKITVNLAVSIAIIAMTVTFVITMLVSMRMFDNSVNSVRAKEVMYNKVAEIDKSLRDNYYGEINNNTLNDMLSAGYLAGINDKNAVYYTAKQYTELQGVLSGQVIGIGADTVKDASGYARIIRVYKDSPAAGAGLEKNWFITHIGEVDVKTLSQSQITAQLRGEEGTNLTLTVTNLFGEEQTITVQRRQYEMTTVEYTVPENQVIGYLKINTFNSNTAQEVKSAIEEMQKAERPVQALVIDLRNNTGASLDDAMSVIDVLCPVGPIASQQNKDGSVKVLTTSDNQSVELPMVMLVNNNTAYGAELLASSIRNFDKGRIVGVQTAGKGTIQCTPVALSDGSAIVYTIGLLLDKNSETFDGVGLSPDVEIALLPDEETNFYTLTIQSDSQIVKAFATAETLLGRTDTNIITDPLQEQPATSDASVSDAAQPEA